MVPTIVIGGKGPDVNGTVEVWQPTEQKWILNSDLNVKHPDQEYVVTLLESHC